MTKTIDPQKCVCCGLDWMTRELTLKEIKENSIPMIFTMSLITNKIKKYVRLVFCDKHGNNHMEYTKTIKQVLYVRNTRTGKMRRASTWGVAA